jgi:hypothetical protein
MIIPWTMFCPTGANGSGVGSRDNRGDDLWLAAPCDQFDRLVNEALERVDFVE